jgi:hypothetical protein
MRETLEGALEKADHGANDAGADCTPSAKAALDGVSWADGAARSGANGRIVVVAVFECRPACVA